jgi:hypothetical protein
MPGFYNEWHHTTRMSISTHNVIAQGRKLSSIAQAVKFHYCQSVGLSGSLNTVSPSHKDMGTYIYNKLTCNEIKSELGKICYVSIKNIPSCSLFFKTLKYIKLTILPVVLYGCKTSSLKRQSA